MVNQVYVELVRAVPILVLILWVYYGLPQVADISISVFWAGCWRWRFRMPSRPKSSVGISRSTGAGTRRSIRRSAMSTDAVLILTAGDQAHPAWPSSQLVYMREMSSLVSVIGMEELTRRANELVVKEYPLKSTVLVLEYLVLIMVSAVRWFDADGCQ